MALTIQKFMFSKAFSIGSIFKDDFVHLKDKLTLYSCYFCMDFDPGFWSKVVIKTFAPEEKVLITTLLQNIPKCQLKLKF